MASENFNEVDNFYRKLLDVEMKYNIPSQVSRLTLIGCESAGKSSFCEFLIGYNVSFKKVGTATRCPTKLTLKKDDARLQRSVTVAGQAVEPHELAERVKQHMQSLGDSFSEKPLEITVTAPDVVNLVIFDLPGLIANPPDDVQAKTNAEQAARMAARYIREPQNLLVIVSKCQEAVTSLAEIPLVNELATNEHRFPPGEFPPARPNWKQSAVFLANYVNHRFSEQGGFLDIKQANEFFKTARQSDRQYHFISLRPVQVDIDQMSFEESERYHRELPDTERRFYEQRVASLEAVQSSAGERWRRENDKLLGVKGAVGAIQEKLRDQLFQELPVIVQRLEALRWQKEKEAQALAQMIEAGDATKVQDYVRHFLTDLIVHFQRSIEGKEVRVVNFQRSRERREVQGRGREQDEKEGPRRFQPDNMKHFQRSSDFRANTPYRYTAEEFGLTFQEECERTPYEDSGEWGGWIPLDELQSERHLGHPGQQLGETLKLKLLGVSAYNRAMQVFEYMLISRDFEEIQDQEMYNTMHSAGSESHINTNAVVMQFAVAQLEQAATGINWLCRLLETHFCEHSKRVCTQLLESEIYRGLPEGVKSLLKMRSLKALKGLLKERLQNAMNQYEHLVESFDEYRPVDKMRKQLMLNLVISMRDMIPPVNILRPQAHRRGQATQTSSVPTGIVWPAPQGQYMWWSGGEQEGADLDAAPRSLQLLEALQKVADHLEGFQGLFNFADIVSPGFQQVFPQDWNMIDFPYLKRCARSYYCSFVIELMSNVQRIWNTEFLHYVAATHKQELVHDFEIFAQELLEDREAWDQAMGSKEDLDRLKHSRDLALAEAEELEEVLCSLPKERRRPPDVGERRRFTAELATEPANEATVVIPEAIAAVPAAPMAAATTRAVAQATPSLPETTMTAPVGAKAAGPVNAPSNSTRLQTGAATQEPMQAAPQATVTATANGSVEATARVPADIQAAVAGKATAAAPKAKAAGLQTG